MRDPGTRTSWRRRTTGGQWPEPRKRSDFLRQAIHLLTDSLDYEGTLAKVAGLALPEFGAWSIVDVCEAGDFRRLAVVHPDPAMQTLARNLQHSWPPETDDPIGAPVVARTGTAQIVADVTDEMLISVARDPENLAALRHLGIGSFLVVPMVARGAVLGAITFVSGPDRQYTASDLDLAQELAAVSALAIEHARMHREAQTARRLSAARAELAERQQRDLEHVLEIQSRLVRGFSHDVKNPLAAAQGYAKLLEQGLIGNLEPRQIESVSYISASIDSAVGLIENLVEYAKSKMGTIEVQPGPTDVGDVVQQMAEEYRAQIEAAGLSLLVEISPVLPVIETDRVRVREVLGNLLSNAVKYTRRGSISLRAAHHPDGRAPWPGAWIGVNVSDTGSGIPPEHHQLVFREFARLEPDVAQGSGLGLAVSRWIADALNARITLESQPARGSTFTLWLPARAATPAHLRDASDSPDGSALPGAAALSSRRATATALARWEGEGGRTDRG